MNRFLILALSLIAASRVFAVEPQTAGSLHASGGYDHRDMQIAVFVNPVAEGRIWLNAKYSYQLLFSERDELLSMVQAASQEIDIAVVNKTTIRFERVIGRFSTDGAALVTVSFETDGYEASYAVVQITSQGNNDILLFNKKDVGDFISVLGKSHSLVNDYQKQAALFK
jgi:hypothetical protein